MASETDPILIEEQLRSRIAADLHDGIGQTLTGLAALSSAHAETLSGEQRADALRIHELVCAAAEEVRRLCHGLSPEVMMRRGLAGGLELLAESVRKDHRRECECEIDVDACVMDEAVALHLLRIAQEAVSNALRHGGAKKIELKVSREGTGVVLEVVDDGCGMNFGQSTKEDGMGVQNMRNRAEKAGLSFEMKPGREHGVHVCCRTR